LPKEGREPCVLQELFLFVRAFYGFTTYGSLLPEIVTNLGDLNLASLWLEQAYKTFFTQSKDNLL